MSVVSAYNHAVYPILYDLLKVMYPDLPSLHHIEQKLLKAPQIVKHFTYEAFE